MQKFNKKFKSALLAIFGRRSIFLGFFAVSLLAILFLGADRAFAAIPTVVLTADRADVIQGDQIKLTVTFGNAPMYCTATSNPATLLWNGRKQPIFSPTGYSGIVVNTTTTFKVTCTNADGTSPESSVTVTARPSLTATLTASPTSGVAPLNVVLKATAGGSATGTINYTFYCESPDDSNVIVLGYDAKYDDVTSNPAVTNVCTYATAGIHTAKVIIERNTAMTVRAMVTIAVTAPPTVTLSTPKTEVDTDDTINLYWKVSGGADSCTASGDWSGSQTHNDGSNGPVGIVVKQDRTFTITCRNASGDSISSVTVTVTDGNCTLNGNNQINASVLCYNKLKVSSGSEFTGSFVARRVEGLEGSNIRFFYDRGLTSTVPPGFRYMNIPAPSEVGNKK